MPLERCQSYRLQRAANWSEPGGRGSPAGGGALGLPRADPSLEFPGRLKPGTGAPGLRKKEPWLKVKLFAGGVPGFLCRANPPKPLTSLARSESPLLQALLDLCSWMPPQKPFELTWNAVYLNFPLRRRCGAWKSPFSSLIESWSKGVRTAFLLRV